MARHKYKSKRASLFGGIFKLAFGVGFVAASIFGVSYSVQKISEVTFSDLYIKAQPFSDVAGDYVQKTGLPLLKKEDDVNENKKVVLKLALVGDSHNDNDNLKQALEGAREESIENAVFLGDYSDVGTADELTAAKKVMDGSGLTYYSIPGDHDLWKSGGVQNFVDIFGKRYQALEFSGVKLILLDNSDNEKGVDGAQLEWFTEELLSLDKNSINFVVMSNPLYNKSNFKLMGENSEDVKRQANLLLSMIRQAPVKAVIAGDNHVSSRSVDPENEDLEHVVVGALTDDRNLQTPRFDILTIFEDGSYEIKEVEIALL